MNGLEDHTLYTFVISRPYIEKGFDPATRTTPYFSFSLSVDRSSGLIGA